MVNRPTPGSRSLTGAFCVCSDECESVLRLDWNDWSKGGQEVYRRADAITQESRLTLEREAFSRL